MTDQADLDKIAALIEKSSLGTPEAKRLRAQAPPEAVQRVMDEIQRRDRQSIDQAVELEHLAEQEASGEVDSPPLFGSRQEASDDAR